jgi:hypothetical protein
MAVSPEPNHTPFRRLPQSEAHWPQPKVVKQKVYFD